MNYPYSTSHSARYICKGISSYGSQKVYERFSQGRKVFDEKEFEEWATSPFPVGLGIQKTCDSDFVAELATILCFTFEKKKFVFLDGMYHERETDKEPDEEGKEIRDMTKIICEVLTVMTGKEVF